MPKPTGIKVVALNRQVRHDFELLEIFEAGLVLTGTEIKSIRAAGSVNLRQAYIQPRNGELWLISAHIAEYAQGNRENHEPDRPRKLLLHRREVAKILEQLRLAGLTCVPTSLYLKGGRAKLEIALARGKKKFDKRQDMAKRDAQRQIDRAIKERY